MTLARPFRMWLVAALAIGLAFGALTSCATLAPAGTNAAARWVAQP